MKLSHVTMTLAFVSLFVLSVAAANPPSATVPAAPQQADLLNWERSDIIAFRRQFLDVDRSFTEHARAEAERRLSRLERRPLPLDPIGFAVELCRVAALADNAHTQCISAAAGREICRQYDIIDRQLGFEVGGAATGCVVKPPDFDVPEFNRVSLRFFPFGDGFCVIGASADASDLLGARLVAVDGRSVDRIRSTLRSFFGGTAPTRDLSATDILVSPNRLHAVRISRSDTAVTYRFLTRSGQRVERTFTLGERVPGWQSIPNTNQASWAFQDLGQLFRWRDAPEVDAIVVQLRSNVDSGAQKIADFLAAAESERVRLGRHNVVLDMRFNGGGNYMLTRDFMTQWPARVPGTIYALTSRETFSAGIASVAYLKQAGGDRVVLVGEASGDRLMFFSEGRPTQLPHSGLFFRPSVARQDFQNGCRLYDDCFAAVAQPGRPTGSPPAVVAAVERKPIAIRSLDPDIATPWTIESWLTGADPALDAVAQAIRHGR